jgi:hypothetical protein
MASGSQWRTSDTSVSSSLLLGESEAFSAFPHVCHDLIGRDVERYTRYIQGRFGGCRRFDHEDATILAANANLCAFGCLLEERREPLPSF